MEGTQPSSSVPSLANGRSNAQSNGGRQRTISVSSDSDKIRTPSWVISGSGDRSIQPAHSSTDQLSHFPGMNGSASGNARRFPLDGSQPPDSSPKSVSQKKRKFSADRYAGFTSVGSSNVGPDHISSGVRDSPMTGSFSSHCEPDSECLKYGSSPGLSYRGESNNRVHEISSTQLGREWCVPFSQ